MSATLSDQLSALGFRPLTSVLRTGFSLRQVEGSFRQVIEILQGWASKKAEDSGFSVDWTKREDKLAMGDFRLDYVYSDDAIAILLEHPDVGQPGRVWISEIAVQQQEDGPQFCTRLGFRQSRTIPQPEPRAPRFLAQIAQQIGAFDQRRLESKPEIVTEGSFLPFWDLLVSSNRQLPIIAISKDDMIEWNYAPDHLGQFLCGIAHTFLLDPAASWALTTACEGARALEGAAHTGKLFSVYDGAIRCYLPGFTFMDSPYDHRLWLPEAIVRANTRPNGFLNLCLSHTFAAATARFEVAPLLTPAALQRRLQIHHRQTSVTVQVVPAPSESVATTAPTAEHIAQEMTLASLESPNLAINEDAVALAPTELETGPEPAQLTTTADISTLTARLEVLHYQSEQQIAEIAETRQQLASLDAAKNSAEAELLQAWSENDQLDSQIGDLTLRFSAVSQENSQLRQKINDLEVYRDLSEELSKRIEVLEGRYMGRGEDPFTRMWQSLSTFVTATQQAATSFEEYKEEARTKEQLAQANDELKQELHKLRMQTESLQRRQIADVRPQIQLELKDTNKLVQFMNDHDHGALVEVMNSARREFRKHPMNDLARITQILTILRDVYIPMKCASEEKGRSDWKERFDNALEAAHLENGPSASIAVTHAYDDHTVKVDGRTLRCSKIRESANHFNHQFFFIVNFAWDDETSTLYVKSFDHGATPTSRT